MPTRPRLLLVEDDRATYTALKGILTLRGWDVVVAISLGEAESSLTGPPFDAVILDLMLPDGDGESLINKVKQKSPNIRVAVTTGVNDTDRIAAVERLHPSALLRKPIALAELLRAISPAA